MDWPEVSYLIRSDYQPDLVKRLSMVDTIRMRAELPQEIGWSSLAADRESTTKGPNRYDRYLAEGCVTITQHLQGARTWITAECSLPRLMFGHNIEVLSVEQVALGFDKLCEVIGKCFVESVPALQFWLVTRLDLVYDHRTNEASSVVSALRTFWRPRAYEYIHDVVSNGRSVCKKAASYTVRVYDKHAQTVHERRAQRRRGLDPDMLASLAADRLRIEYSARKSLLSKRGKLSSCRSASGLLSFLGTSYAEFMQPYIADVLGAEVTRTLSHDQISECLRRHVSGLKLVDFSLFSQDVLKRGMAEVGLEYSLTRRQLARRLNQIDECLAADGLATLSLLLPLQAVDDQ
jgi:hypothetical protein